MYNALKDSKTGKKLCLDRESIERTFQIEFINSLEQTGNVNINMKENGFDLGTCFL